MSFRKGGFKLRTPGLSFRRACFGWHVGRAKIKPAVCEYLRVVFLLIITFNYSALFSQNFLYKNWTVSDGLSSNEVHSILLKNNGELLLGTDNGVQIFDGENFKPIPARDEKFSSLTAFSIDKMMDGEIWVRTCRHGLFRIENDTLVPYVHNALILNESKSFVGQYFVDKKGSVHYTYYLPGSPGVYVINRDGELSKKSLSGIQDSDSASKYGFNYNGEIVLVQSAPDKGLIGERQEENDNSFVKFQSDVHYFDESFFRRNAFLNTNNSTYVAFNNSVIQFGNKGKSLSRFDLADRVIKLVGFENDVYALTLSGVYLLSPQSNNHKKLYLNGLTVTDMIGDQEGGIWFSTTESGLYYLASRQIYLPSANSPLIDPHLHQIAAHGNRLLTLNLESVLHLYEFVDGEYKLQSSFTGYDYQISHYLKLTGDEFFLNFTRGEIKRGKLAVSAIDKYPKIGNDILKGDDNSFLIASNFRGVLGLDANGHTFFFNRRDTTSFPAYALERCWDTVFVGLKDGLYQFLDGKYKPVYVDQISSPVITMCVWDNKLVVGTKGQGLFIISPTEVSHLSRKQKLGSNNIQSLAVSENGRLWIASTAGLSVVNDDYEIFTLNEDDGLLSSVVKSVAYANGRINVLTESGFCFLDTSISKPIENFDLSLYLPIENRTIAKDEYLVLPLGKRDVFLNIEENSLRYKSTFNFKVLYKSDTLEAPDGKLSLAGLEPGTHELKVLAGLKGIFPVDDALFTVHVPAYYYEENWFKALMVLLGLGLIATVIMHLQQQAEFRRTTKMKTSLAQYEALNLQINPHFLFNSLNNIKVLSSNDPSSRINHFVGKLSKLTRNVLENSKHTTISLREELDNIQRFVDIENIRFQQRPIKFQMTIDQKLNLDKLAIPPMILQPSVENAIWHGLLPKESGVRELQLVVKEITSGFLVQISDNGLGWKNKQPSQEFEVNKTSIGLKNTIERLKMYEDMQLGKASLKLEEKRDTEGQYCGMLVSFVFYPKF